jgi:hypothetical protein
MSTLYIPTKVRECSKFKRDNSVKNWDHNQIDLDLHISMTYLHKQFQPYAYTQTKDRESGNWNFLKKDNFVKIIRQ